MYNLIIVISLFSFGGSSAVITSQTVLQRTLDQCQTQGAKAVKDLSFEEKAGTAVRVAVVKFSCLEKTRE